LSGKHGAQKARCARRLQPTSPRASPGALLSCSGAGSLPIQSSLDARREPVLSRNSSVRRPNALTGPRDASPNKLYVRLEMVEALNERQRDMQTVCSFLSLIDPG
jgi:hypothetical protein